MAMGEPVRKGGEAAVVALRKRLRGEPLTAAEAALLGDRARRPEGTTVPHAQVMAELEERRKREESSPRRK